MDSKIGLPPTTVHTSATVTPERGAFVTRGRFTATAPYIERVEWMCRPVVTHSADDALILGELTAVYAALSWVWTDEAQGQPTVIVSTPILADWMRGWSPPPAQFHRMIEGIRQYMKMTEARVQRAQPEARSVRRRQARKAVQA